MTAPVPVSFRWPRGCYILWARLRALGGVCPGHPPIGAVSNQHWRAILFQVPGSRSARWKDGNRIAQAVDGRRRCNGEGLSCMDSAYTRGRGIDSDAPPGCFEDFAGGVPAVQRGSMQSPLLVARPPAGYGRGPGSASGPELKPRRLSTLGVRQIKALRAGRAVSLLPDQVPPGNGRLFRSGGSHDDAGRPARHYRPAQPSCWSGERLPWGGFVHAFREPEHRFRTTRTGRGADQPGNGTTHSQCPQQFTSRGYGRTSNPRRSGEGNRCAILFCSCGSGATSTVDLWLGCRAAGHFAVPAGGTMAQGGIEIWP